jgi:hypothetical protein
MRCLFDSSCPIIQCSICCDIQFLIAVHRLIQRHPIYWDAILFHVILSFLSFSVLSEPFLSCSISLRAILFFAMPFYAIPAQAAAVHSAQLRPIPFDSVPVFPFYWATCCGPLDDASCMGGGGRGPATHLVAWSATSSYLTLGREPPGPGRGRGRCQPAARHAAHGDASEGGGQSCGRGGCRNVAPQRDSGSGERRIGGY